MDTASDSAKVLLILKKILKDNFSIKSIADNCLFTDIKIQKSRFIELLNQAFNLTLKTQVFWEYPSVEKLARHIAFLTGKEKNDSLERIQHKNLRRQESIAVIGMGCRFPGGADNCDKFWQLLSSGKDPIKEIPLSRWNVDELYAEDYHQPGKMSTRYGGFLEDVELFDASFFNISPKEAMQMDPQQRIFLEVAWQALEYSGSPIRKLSNTSTGVFVGISMHDYERLLAKYGQHELIDAYSNLGAAFSAVGARLSYFLGLNGPSFAIDTACSSSLSALYNACLSLRSGDCDMALSGGINLILDPEPTIGYSQAHMMAPDGRCKTFDKRANGYVRSEGCGVVVLKRLDDALKDGDTIYAVIKSVVANQDGASNGLTAPNMVAQVSVLQDGLYCADLKPNQIDLFETHGTGTFVGDPIEVDAINRVYGNNKRSSPLYLGALKSQIGHCEAAAGIAGLIKVILAMQHKEIPANLHFQTLNPSIDIDQVPCRVPTQPIPWDGREPRRAAISSYGFTGTNTHAVLEQAPTVVPQTSIELPQRQLFVLSAKTKRSLKKNIKQYINYLSHTPHALSDICYTLAVGRMHFNYRIAFKVTDKQELIEKLSNPKLKIHEIEYKHEPLVSDDVDALLDGYLAGKECGWEAYYEPYAPALRKLGLPAYCFDKQRYWIDLQHKNDLGFGDLLHPLLGTKLPGYSDKIRFLNKLGREENNYLNDHKIYENVIFPGAALIESMLAAGENLMGSKKFALQAIEMLSPIALNNNNRVNYQVNCLPVEQGYDGKIYSPDASNEWKLHASFELRPAISDDAELRDIKALKFSMKKVDAKDVYADFRLKGIAYGKSFQTINEIYRNDTELLVKIENKSIKKSSCFFHPVLLDGVFQASMFFDEDKIYLPSTVDCVRYCKSPQSFIWVHITLQDKTSNALVSDAELYSDSGERLMKIEGYHARSIDKSNFNKLLHTNAVLPSYIEQYETWQITAKANNVATELTLFAAPEITNWCEKNWDSLKLDKGKLNKANSLGKKHIVYLYQDSFEDLIRCCQKVLQEKPASFILILKGGFDLKETVNPSHMQALAFWKTVAHEAGDIPFYVIDSFDLAKIPSLLKLIVTGQLEEHQLILRDTLYVPRLVPLEDYQKHHKKLPVAESDQSLTCQQGIDSLNWSQHPIPSLNAHQVKIDIHSVGLNFRDVLKAMNLYPGDAGDLGYECSGIVLEIGSKVKDLQKGDRVVALAIKEPLFSQQAVLHHEQVVKVSDNVSMNEAASIPLVFATAYHALVKLAQVKRGQKILIHAATGGVGLAAIQIAQQKGAIVYATTSLPKQAYLHEHYGIEYIYDSRNIDFAKEILNDTDNQGVDVVLNSLTSEGFIESSLSCLKKNGVFLEIGKNNIYSKSDMEKARADVAYHIIEMDERILHEPQSVQKELEEVLTCFDKQALKPLPVTSFSISDVKQAFHYLQSARHIGKVVVTMKKPFCYRADATYLITGGTGALGKELVNHLISQGVKYIKLTSRNALNKKALQWITHLVKQGIDITHSPIDVADKNQLEALFDEIQRSKYPLKGIFHVAGILKDGTLNTLNIKDFQEVMRPKILGSEHLHELSKTLSLDCFVLFSSIVARLGNLGQANYAAANGFMDGLASLRTKQGLPALSINWGAFARIGMAKDLASYHQSLGWKPHETSVAFTSMDLLLNETYPNVMLADMNWNKVSLPQENYISHLKEKESADTEEGWYELLRKAGEQRKQLFTEKLQALTAEILNISDAATVDIKKGFFEQGMDSLMSVDFKNKLQQQLKDLKLNNTIAFDFGNIESLRDHLLEKLVFKDKVETSTPTPINVEREEKVEQKVNEEDIAIIGMSCHFPKANNLEEYWELLSQEKDAISEVPKERFDINTFYDPDPKAPGKSSTRRAGFIDNISLFDNQFFSVSPKEAEFLDPQQRLLLTQTWQALEHAGIDPLSLKNQSVGVFVGILTAEYRTLIDKYNALDNINAYIGTGNSLSTASGRISYTFGLQGPSISIDTACSSSLVALNEACNYLRAGECKSAIVGGVNALLTPEVFINFSKAGMLAPDGKCKTFDESANGYVRGEGCGVVILKRLADAIKDNDTVLAVIKAAGINQDGASSGLTVPNGQSQSKLITSVLTKSKLSAEEIDYVECHGTGTSLGDPIEVHALGEAYGKKRKSPLYIGSVKTNIGHLEAAAGIAGLIKTVLALNHHKIPRHLNFNRLNPHITLDFPAEVVSQAIDWRKNGTARRAAVSSFGFSGTNAHVILEEAPAVQERDSRVQLPENNLFVLSAKSERSLTKLVNAYSEYLATTEDWLADICYTAAVGRSHFDYRLAVIVRSKEALRKALSDATFSKATLSSELIESDDPDTLCAAYLAGKSINWPQYYAPYIKALRKVHLPLYHFDAQHYWIEIKKEKTLPFGTPIHELLGARLPGYGGEIRFLNILEASEPTYLQSHKVFGEIIFPGAGLIESALAAGQTLNEGRAVTLSAVSFLKPLHLMAGSQYEYQLSLIPADSGYNGRIDAHCLDAEWSEYARFHLSFDAHILHRVADIKLLQSGKESRDVDELYAEFSRLGLEYGPEFQVIKKAYVGAQQALVLIELAQMVNYQNYNMHPTLLDGAFQSILLLTEGKSTYIPSSLEKLVCSQPLGSRIWIEIHILEKDARALNANLVIYDEQGMELARLEGFRARSTDKQALQKLTRQSMGLELYSEAIEAFDLPEKAPIDAPVAVYAGDRAKTALDKSFQWRRVQKEQDWSGHHLVMVYEENLSNLLRLAQGVLQHPPLSFTLVVQKAFAMEDEVIAPAQREALGFWRTFTQEAGGNFPCYLIDAYPLSDAASVLNLIVQKALPEPEVIVRGKNSFVPRLYHEETLIKHRHQLPLPEEGHYLLSESGIDTLHWTPRMEHSLQSNEIRVRIAATALNFRDVLNAMDLYPGDAGDLGCECAGEIVETGSAVQELSVGERVVVVGEGLFGMEAVVDANRACVLPSCLSMSEGAALPIVFLTANYALNVLASIKRGQKVLIHAATGGVGLAAIAFARLAGATIYATASNSKQKYLREVLEIEHVYDSRSIEFGAKILEETAGAGVDIVLNSLTSEGFIESSLSCLKSGGTFLEIGKINIYSKEQMDAVRPDVAYHIIALDNRIAEEAAVVKKELQAIMQLFAQKKLLPLPIKEFSVSDTRAAFHYLQKAQQIGKVIVNNSVAAIYRPDASYLITGGTGGLGLALAEHLIAQGLEHLVLTSRRPLNDEQKSWIEAKEQAGIEICHYQADVSDKKAISQVFSTIAKGQYPLKGIFHTAGVLHDGTLMNLTSEDFNKVLAPKVLGAQHLDDLSRALELDYFVLFSSMTSLLGSPGQSNYTAANAFMDGLAVMRRQQGLPALSINWGAFAGVGMAAQLTQRHGAQGILPLQTDAAFQRMDALLQNAPAQIALMRIDWAKITLAKTPYLSHLIIAEDKQEGEWVQLLEATPADQRQEMLTAKLKQLVAEVLHLSDIQQIENSKGFFDMGMDSLMAVDLKNKVQQKFSGALEVSNTLAFDYNNIQLMRGYLLERLDFKEKIPEAVNTERPYSSGEPSRKESRHPERSEGSPDAMEMSRKTRHDESNAGSPDAEDAVAIIGISADFPGAEDVEAFWRLLIEGREAISQIPADRWEAEDYYDSDPQTPGKMITKRGGFIQNIEQFDNAFFAISPKEATYLDPQQRLLLTQTWRALEDAGIAPESLMGSDTGVFIGIATHDYSDLIHHFGNTEAINAYIGTGNSLSTASGRISYTLGLEGPSLAIDTACSSSLTALNEACKWVSRGDCAMAIVGGVNALLSPDLFINFSKAGMLSPDGRCKTFDEKADGYVRGEGCGVVIVKRLSDALADNDRILAVIRALGINQDGASSGLTVPNGVAQERLLRKVLTKSGFEPEEVDYVECHGTGTSLGDPIEVHALGEVYGQNRSKPLYLGSVKTNIGHLEAAAGIAGLIKTVMAFNKEQIPPHLHFSRLNPHIRMNFPAEIVTTPRSWPRHEKTRRAAISSFGFSGTNAHVILEEAPALPERDASITLPAEQIFVLSAKNHRSLNQLIMAYSNYLEQTEDSLPDICYTAAVGRNHFNYRLAIKASSIEDLKTQLAQSKPLIQEVKPSEKSCCSGNTEELMAAYLSGKRVNWAEYYAPYIKALRKVRLPTYRFDTKAYWLPMEKTKVNKDWQRLSQWCYTQAWEEITESSQKLVMSTDELMKHTLVITANKRSAEIWQEFSPVLIALHDETITRLPVKDSGYCCVNLFDKTQTAQLLKTKTFNQVILLCDQTNTPIPEQGLQWIKILVNVSKSLIQQNAKTSLLVITQRAQWVRPADSETSSALALSLAPMLGFIKSLQIEAPQLRCRLIDVEDINRYEAMQKLLSEWSGLNEEVILARRQNHYYAPRVVQQKIELTADFQANNNGTYLITGGMGALGQIIAQWLIERGAKHMALMGRHQPTGESLQHIQQWQAEGIDISLYQGSVGDKVTVMNTVQSLQQSAYPLCGIFHLAGLGDTVYLKEIELEKVENMLHAKTAGAWYLHEASKELHLDCFVLFSSIAAFIGSQKQSLYAAANHFLDQLAFYRVAMGLPASCIDWGPWASVGMASRIFNDEKMNNMGLEKADLIDSEQAMVLLSHLLSSSAQTQKQALASMAFVSPNYLRFMLNFMPTPLPSWIKYIQSQLPQIQAATTVDTQELTTSWRVLDEAARKAAIQSIVCSVVSQVLGIENPEDLDINQGFFEMGMDSLMAVDIQNKLRQQLGQGIVLRPNLAFDYPAISAVRDYIYNELFQEESTVTVEPEKSFSREDIAVIGMSCRFPGNADDPEKLWELLANGRDGIVEVPQSRWDIEQYYDPDPNAPGKICTRHGGFIDDIEQFDARFFNINPQEAKLMDPQQRMFLETSYAALESSGYPLETIKGSSGGVFVGVSASEYGAMLNALSNPEDLNIYYATGNALNAISGRLSYIFGLEGPSEAIDTACSSSLVALHHGIQSLRNKECDFAIVGGVNALLSPQTFISLSKGNMLSPEGRCKTFDEKADGYVRAEGCGVLILKRMSDALKDKDTVLAVLKGSAVNQDGFSSALTAPRGPAQQAVIKKALENAGVSAEMIGYVEAHGTGTSLGDPIEVDSLAKVYGTAHSEQAFHLGSIKTNIGHLESASGIAGVIKVILSMRHEAIPPHLHFNQLNPHIDLAAANAQLPLTMQPWKTNGKKRLAAVSSFGFSGTNAHVIIEEAPAIQEKTALNLPEQQLFVLSAKSQASLEKMVAAYRDYLQATPDSLGEICYTAAVGRTHFKHRLALLVHSKNELLEKLLTAPLTEVTPTSEVVNDNDLNILCQAYLSGKTVDWQAFYAPYKEGLQKVFLPSYCFDKKYYWMDAINHQNNKNPHESETEAVEYDRETAPITKPEQIQEILLTVWRQQFDQEDIDPQTDFFELGGDSLLAIQLVQAMSQASGRAIQPHHLQQYPNVAALTQWLSQGAIEDTAPFVLVKLHEAPGQSAKPPLFMLHAVGGTVYFYRDIAQRMERDVYGIQSQALDGHSPVIEDVGQLAADYIKAIQTVQAHGPYYLAGASFGGALAYEIAQQLESLNEPVAMLAMFDTPGMSGKEDTPDSVFATEDSQILAEMLFLNAGHRVKVETLQQMTETERLTYYLQNRSQSIDYVADKEGIEGVKRMLQFYKGYTRALTNYAIKPYQQKTTKVYYYRAAEQERKSLHPETGWQRVIPPEMLLVKTVSGNHFTMLDKSHATKGLIEDLQQACREAEVETKAPAISIIKTKKTEASTYMFPGQGAQTPGMGESLFAKFSEEVQQANDILGYSIEELCLRDSHQQLNNTQYTQPALYVVEALSFLERGALPSNCIGHSLGEYGALFAAGVFDFADGLKLVKKRGELMAQASGGAMLAVINIPSERIISLLEQHGLENVDCANLNSPKQTVLSGSAADIAAANQVLSAEGAMCVPLRVSGAFHSHYMNEAAQEFRQFLEPFEFNEPSVTVIANVSAAPYTRDNIKENLVNQITSPVRWFESIQYLRQNGETEFIEVGPGNVLSRLLPQI